MIDLIIPYYNNPEGLLRTLNSINTDIFNIVVIDDCSTIKPPLSLKVNQYYRYNINSGPGFARQHGINKTSNPYIMFIDTGDIFTSPEAQYGILNTITLNPQLDFISFPYFHNNKITQETDNRLHGKIYKRSFLKKYNITFSSESTYLNEDIGFNRTCRLCGKMTFISLPVIEQINDANSLTQKNNQVVLYKDQTKALSLVSIHTIDICRRNNIDPNDEINQIAAALYYWFLKTVVERPEYIINAWRGAKIFYQYFKNDIDLNNFFIGNPELKKCFILRDKLSFPINVKKFIREMWQEKNIPSYYLT